MTKTTIRKQVTTAKARLEKQYPNLSFRRMNANNGDGIEITLNGAWHRLVHQTKDDWAVIAQKQPMSPVAVGDFEKCFRSFQSICSGPGIGWNQVTARSAMPGDLETKEGKYVRTTIKRRGE